MLLSMRRLLGSTLALALLVGTLGAGVAHAQQDFVESDPGVVRAREQVAAAQLAAHQAAQELEATRQQRDEVQSSIDDPDQVADGLLLSEDLRREPDRPPR